MAGKQNLKIEQGATFRQMFTWKAGKPAVPVDLTGCTARMQIRADVTAAVPYVSLTTENNGITLGGAAGTILILISATDTALMSWTSGVYDLEIQFGDGTVRRLVEGRVQVSPEVTRG